MSSSFGCVVDLYSDNRISGKNVEERRAGEAFGRAVELEPAAQVSEAAPRSSPTARSG